MNGQIHGIITGDDVLRPDIVDVHIMGKQCREGTQFLTVQARELKMLVRYSEIELLFADGFGAFSQDWPEALSRARHQASGRVLMIDESRGRRRNRQQRQFRRNGGIQWRERLLKTRIEMTGMTRD